MTLYPNQFEQDIVKGALDLAFNPLTVSCMISSNEVATLVAGDAVTIENGYGGVPRVLKATADSDKVFGFVVRNLKKSSLVANDFAEVALHGNVIYLEAGAAIARGALVSIVAATSKVTTQTGALPASGYAYDKAGADGDLIRVYVLTPVVNSATLVTAALSVVGNAGVGGNLEVIGTSTLTGNTIVTGTSTLTGDVTFGANAIKKTVAYGAGAGQLPLTADKIFLTTGGAEALTLANGVLGQELEIIMVVDGGEEH